VTDDAGTPFSVVVVPVSPSLAVGHHDDAAGMPPHGQH
jgi:hypothetical protein